MCVGVNKKLRPEWYNRCLYVLLIHVHINCAICILKASILIHSCLKNNTVGIGNVKWKKSLNIHHKVECKVSNMNIHHMWTPYTMYIVMLHTDIHIMYNIHCKYMTHINIVQLYYISLSPNHSLYILYSSRIKQGKSEGYI